MNQAIALETLRQIGGVNRLGVMIGAHSFVASDDGVSFRFLTRARDGINRINIFLDPTDTYTVEFVRSTRHNYSAIDSMTGIYCDNLKNVIEQRTGLRLSM